MADATSNTRKFLDFLGRAEGADYNTIVGGKKFQDYSKHPGIVGLKTADGVSTAAGKYQITKTTYDSLAPRLGISDFSPASQDKVALALIDQKGAMEDVVSGNFKSAIKKLGGTWASLPSSTYKQPKRSWDWVDKTLGDQGLGRHQSILPEEITTSRNSGDILSQTQPRSAALIQADALQEQEHGWDDLPADTARSIYLNYQNNDTIWNAYQTQQARVADGAAIDWSDKDTDTYLKGVSPSNWDYILEAKTHEEAANRLARYQDSLKNAEELSRMGLGPALMGGLAAGIIDLPNLLAMGTGVGVATSASRVTRAFQSGIATAAFNTGTDALTADLRPLATDNDLYTSAALGFSLGSLTGAISKPRGVTTPLTGDIEDLGRTHLNIANQLMAEDIARAGGVLTPEGRQALAPVHAPLNEETLVAAGLRRNSEGEPVYDEQSLSAIRGDSGMPAVSTDGNQVTYSMMKALKNSQVALTDNILRARELIANAYGKDVLEGLEARGRVKLLDSEADLPAALRGGEKKTNAFYDPMTDTTFMLADRLTPDTVRGLMLHEVGVHHGLERVVGADVYEHMLGEVERLAKAGDGEAAAAVKRADANETRAFLKPEERLAYYMEGIGNKTIPGFLRKALARVKQFLINKFGANLDLKPADLVAIVEGSLRKVAKDANFGSFRGLPRVWHGSPTKGIERFSTDHIGTGEGNVNQGFGIYTTSSKFIANWYRDKESIRRGLKGEDGGLYQLKVHNATPSQFLQWDSARQSRRVLEALKGAGIDPAGRTGREIYFDLMGKQAGDTALAKAKATSEFLDSIGIRGNVYAAGSRGAGRRGVLADNFVIFNDNNLEIHQRFSKGEAAGTEEAPPATTSLGLAYENILLGDKAPESVRAAMSKIISPTAGWEDGSVVKVSAAEDASAWRDAAVARTRKEWMPAMEEWKKANGYEKFDDAKAGEHFGEKIWEAIVWGDSGDIDPHVAKAAAVVRKELGDWTDRINNPLIDVGGTKRGLTEYEVVDPLTGQKSIEGALDRNPDYMPRKIDPLKWDRLAEDFSDARAKMEQWFANARRAVDPEGISAEEAARFGKRYVAVVDMAHGNRSSELLDDLISQGNGARLGDFLREMTDSAGRPLFSAEEVDEAVRDLTRPSTPSSDAGRINSSLRHRNTLNERYKEFWTLPDGTQREVTLKDFMHCNALDLSERYYHRMAGAVALAKHADIYKSSDITKFIQEMTNTTFGDKRFTRASLDTIRIRAREVFDNVQGIPREDWTWWKKGLGMLNKVNLLRLGGKFFLNQIQETGQTTGALGHKALLHGVSELESLSRDVKTGKAPTDYLHWLENTVGGSGAEYIQRLEFKASDDWVRHYGPDSKLSKLDTVDHWLSKSGSALMSYTGMTPLMITQKRAYAQALVNHFVDVAHGASSTLLNDHRLATMGIGKEDWEAIKKAIVKYSSPAEGEFAKHMKLDVERFNRDMPELNSKLRMALWRESRRVIQENDLASTVPIMGTAIGQSVFQFMNFAMNAWNKQMVFAWRHRDMATFNTILHGMFYGTLAYLGKTQLDSIGMDDEAKKEFMDKRLNPKQFAFNVAGRLGQMSLLPNIYDSMPFTPPMFSGMRTTSDLSGIASLPSVGLANAVIGSSKKVLRSAFSDETQMSQKDMKSLLSVLPLSNAYPIVNLTNALVADYPTTDVQ